MFLALRRALEMRYPWRILWIGIAVLVLRFLPWGESQGKPLYGFARLSETQGGIRACFWVSQNERLCFSPETWGSGLLESQGEVRHSSTQTSLRIFRANRLQSSLGHASAAQTEIREVLVSAFPLPRGPSILWNFHLWIEKKRWEAAHRIDAHWVRRIVLDLRQDAEWEENLRVAGWVHVWTAAGIHLLVLLGWLGRWRAVGSVFLVWVWCLSGGRDGLFRPWVLLLLKDWGGTRSSGWASPFLPLGLALALDELFALVISYWSEGQAVEWGMGRGHYLAAVMGGLWGYRLGHPGEARFKTHLRMAVFSWVFVLPVDLLHSPSGAWIAPGTPLFSLLSVPLLTQVGYPFAVFLLSLPETVWSLIGTEGEQLSKILISGAQAIDTSLQFAEDFGRLTQGLTGWSWIRLDLWSACLGCVWAAVVLWRKSNGPAVRFGSVLLLLILGAVREEWQAQSLWSQRAQEDQLCVREWNGWSTRLTLKDVGQGDSLWVHSQNPAGESQLTLIDVGGKKATRVLAWISELADLGLSRVDRLILSHLDEDHAGKVRDLISWVEVKEVWVPLAQRSRLEEVGLRRALTEAEIPLHFYEDWEQDATGLAVWSEPEGPSPGAANSGMGGVLHPCVGSGWVYSGFGDARAATEKHWAREVRERIHALTDGDRPLIWKATHHGSNAQNALETLSLLRPAQVWVSAGSGNRYGHPGWAFLERVEGYAKERGHPAVQLRRTDEEGSLVP